MHSTSVYAVAENESPKWRPGEEAAASAFVGMTFFLVLSILFEMMRLFRKRQGLYFWSMLAGASGCGIDNLGIIFKFLAPDKSRWLVYTLLLCIGWSTYSLAQLLILYSRLHLVNQDRRIHRVVLAMSVSTFFAATIPTWIVVFQAWNPDPHISSMWSPREAIVERYNQILYTLVELIISGIYIVSLVRVLYSPNKQSVRQRRVMLDLIYVSIIVVALDILSVVLVYLNQTGLSHPIQTFSYAFKIRLEFIVLNQLMSVAARGLKRETFEEKRYHHTSQQDTFSAEMRHFGIGSAKKTGTSDPDSTVDVKKVASRQDPSKDNVQISMPSPVFSRGHQPSDSAASRRKSVASTSFKDDISEEVSQAPPESPDEDSTSRPWGWNAMQSLHRRSRRDGSEANPLSARGRVTRHNPRPGDDDDEDEIGLHMWENRGKVVLEVPWFKTAEHAHDV